MTKRASSLSPLAFLAVVAVLSTGACQPQAGSRSEPQAKRRCHDDYKQSYWAVIDDRKGADERAIAAITDFARTNGMDHETNRYPTGVPGNTHPQFLVSICNEHFYALAGNQERGSVTVHILSDKLEHEAGVDPLAVSVASRLQDEFEDVEFSSDLREGLNSRNTIANDRATPRSNSGDKK